MALDRALAGLEFNPPLVRMVPSGAYPLRFREPVILTCNKIRKTRNTHKDHRNFLRND